MGIKYQGHSATSLLAAAEIQERASNLRGFVYRYIKKSGESGATDEEVHTGLNMNPSTERPRRIELVEKGLVVDSGRKRHTRSKRLAVVWIARK